MTPLISQRFAVLGLFLVSTAHAWVSSQHRRTLSLAMTMSAIPEQTEDPCWQDLYDDDCSMSSVYSASFVAGKWIKSMPCASGLEEDCDMGGLDVPTMRPEAGVDMVDVMNFLGLKKAAPVTKKEDGEGEVAP